ncbi:metal-dependent hydrolase [Lacipirellula limnantheis]|uniref:Inner membrane protein n=1 Tax=Lacipirellula limnantheis TaxID=2528024 RepID=A0A517U2N0_9BACT|nr:metal-dependent hydrolase [Lacipirellula limnantheis]QDT74881.1 hypothetical protein I41_40850 [Lacipirellula limnantheis]
MAGFTTHITTSCTLGAGYAALGAYHGLPIEASLVAGCLCGVGGMLPDIDSDSGVPLRETMSFFAAVVPMMLVDRFQHFGWNYEQMVLAGAASYLTVRFGIAKLLKRATVHRGMFHSIPALLIFTGVTFLVSNSTNLHLRYFKAGGVFIGVLSHLMLDEIYSIEWSGGRWRFKKSFGTAIKLWGDDLWGNFSVYWKLAVVVVMILSEPSIMERYGQLSPIIVNNQAIKNRLVHEVMPDQRLPQLASDGTNVPSTFRIGFQQPSTRPTPGDQPAVDGLPHDRTIYDTARRIMKRFSWKK